MTTKIIVTFYLSILLTWTTKPEEMKVEKANFQVNNKTFWKFEVNAVKKSVKVPQVVIKITDFFLINTFINTFLKKTIFENFVSLNTLHTLVNIN